MDGRKKFVCPEPACGISFSRKWNRDRHLALEHNNVEIVHSCVFCGGVFSSSQTLRQHRQIHEPQTDFILHQSSQKQKCVIYRKSYGKRMTSFQECVQLDTPEVYKKLEYELANRHVFKASLVYYTEFIKLTGVDSEEQKKKYDAEKKIERNTENSDTVNDEGKEQRYEVCLRAPSCLITTIGDILRMQDVSKEIIEQRIDDFVENGSGWIFGEVVCTNVEIGNCKQLTGSCNFLSIKHLSQMKKIRKSDDEKNQCFFQAVAFHFTKTAKRSVIARFIKEKLNTTTTKTPVSIRTIPNFERQNKHLQLKINVLSIEDEQVFPIYFSKNVNKTNVITLLLYETRHNEKAINHYVYIRNIDSFLNKRYGKTNYYEKGKRCLNCFAKFTSKRNRQEQLNTHYKNCLENKPQVIRVPKDGATLHFKNFNNKFKTPYIGFFDFESAHKAPPQKCETCHKKGVICQHSATTKAIQIPITVSFLILDWNEQIIASSTYTGYDCVDKFFDELFKVEDMILAKKEQPLVMTKKMEKQFKTATVCHICEHELLEDKVRDHCHRTGDFLGAAHNLCNLQRREKNTIPMFCHNLSGYDSHFLMQRFGFAKKITSLSALPYNTERFRTITMNSFTFLDSLSFLNASLDELTNDLVQSSSTFSIMEQLKLYKTVEEKKLLLRKGVYCYEYVTSIERLEETKKLPPKKDFYSTLKNTNVSDDDYDHAKKVFIVFQCRNMRDYTELYCATDVGLLAEIVVAFRHVTYTNFGLDCW